MILKLVQEYGLKYLYCNASRFGRLVDDWSVENMTSDMTAYGRLSDFNISQKDETNKQISSGEIELNVICGGTKFISYM